MPIGYYSITLSSSSTSGLVARFSLKAEADPVATPMWKALSKSPFDSMKPVINPATIESPAPTEFTKVPLGAGHL